MTMEGRSDKRCITGTFSITFSNEFLPTLLIYDGKTVKSLPRFKFPQQFSLSANPTHFSNSSESIKLFEEVIIRYLQKERKKLNLSPILKGLIIMDVFKGQMTSEVLTILNNNNVSRQYSNKHDKILLTFGLNGQRTCETLLEK